MSVQGMARRYAAALADVVTERNESREVQEELSAWEMMMQGNSDLLEVFRNPTIPYDQKRGVLDTLIARTGVRQTTANFLQVLLRNHRLAELREINTRFAQELDDRRGIVVAHVTTARNVADTDRVRLADKLSDLTGRRVRLQFDVDDELIGGVVTRIGSTVYDGSVRTRLEQIKLRMAGEQ